MQRKVIDCDYTGEKNVSSPIQLFFQTGRDSNGIEMEITNKILDVSPRAAERILNSLILEMSFEQQAKLYSLLVNKTPPRAKVGFDLNISD